MIKDLGGFNTGWTDLILEVSTWKFICCGVPQSNEREVKGADAITFEVKEIKKS